MIVGTPGRWSEPTVEALNQRSPPVAHTTELPPFTPAEQARLTVYKVAVATGLYAETIQDQTNRFTADELARLVVYKAAIAAGFYSDQIEEEDLEG
jgi:hypothetical protein